MNEHKFALGDRVQLREEDEETLVGEIKGLRSTEENGETINLADVLWDVYTETEECYVDTLEVEGQEDELEVEFKKVAEAHMDEIEDQLEIAAKAIVRAQEISEEHGLPFYAGVSPLSQTYTPGSFYSNFSELSRDFVYNLTEAFPGGEYGQEGWEHSAVC